MHLSWMITRLIDKVADWIVGSIEWGTTIGTDRPVYERHTWTIGKEDPL